MDSGVFNKDAWKLLKTKVDHFLREVVTGNARVCEDGIRVLGGFLRLLTRAVPSGFLRDEMDGANCNWKMGKVAVSSAKRGHCCDM